MEEETRPLNARDKKIIAESKIVEKLQKEEGCKLLDCGVVINNVNLRIEIIDLKRKVREQEKTIELMAEAIRDYKDWTDMVCNIVDCTNTPHCNAETKEQELNCIIDYFRKKVRGE